MAENDKIVGVNRMLYILKKCLTANDWLILLSLQLEDINTAPIRAVHCDINKYIILKYFDMKLVPKAKLSITLMGGR